MTRVEQDPRREDRREVVRLVGAAIARTEATPIPILAEGSVACALPAAPTPGREVRRAAWPWVAAGAAIAIGLAGAVVLAERRAAQAHDARYPIVASAAERALLDREGDRWRRGQPRLLTALARFEAPSLDALIGVGACPLAIAAPPVAPGTPGTPTPDAVHGGHAGDLDAELSTRLVVLPDEALAGLDALARPELDALLAAAARGRFRTEAGRAHVVHALERAFLVVTLDTVAPELAAGTAYVFEPSSGALRCAGRFRAEAATPGDLEAETHRAIASSLRAID